MHPNIKSYRQHNFVLLLKIWQSLTLNWGCLDLFLFILNPICSCFFLPLFLTFFRIEYFSWLHFISYIVFLAILLFQWSHHITSYFQVIYHFIYNTRNSQQYNSRNSHFYSLGFCVTVVILSTFICYKPHNTFSLKLSFFVVVEYRNMKCTILTLKCTIEWHQVHSHCCATLTTVQLQKLATSSPF